MRLFCNNESDLHDDKEMISLREETNCTNKLYDLLSPFNVYVDNARFSGISPFSAADIGHAHLTGVSGTVPPYTRSEIDLSH